MNKGREFKCASCGIEHIADWTEEEAMAEMRRNYGELPEEDRAVVCDTCYKRIRELEKRVN